MDEKTPVPAADPGELQNALNDIERKAPFMLVWVWAVLAASLLHYTFLRYDVLMVNPAAVWPVTLILAALYSALMTPDITAVIKPNPLSAALGSIWKGFAGLVIIALMLGIAFGWHITGAVIIAGLGMASMATSGLIGSRMMFWTGIPVFLLAGASMYLPPDSHLLLLAAAVLLNLLIPSWLYIRKT